MQGIRCPKCNAAIPKDATLCSLCGHTLIIRNKRRDRLTHEKQVLEERLAQIFRFGSDETTEVDTIPCPNCRRKIVPQFTYTGRKYLLLVSNFGVEKHGVSRFCPLCGADIDAHIESTLRRIKEIDAIINGKFWQTQTGLVVAVWIGVVIIMAIFLLSSLLLCS